MSLPSIWPRRTLNTRRWPSNVEDLFGSFLADWPSESSAPAFPVDVEETERQYVVHANMPGVRKEDLDIAFEDNVLSITAKFGGEHEEKGKNFLHRERWSGKTTRSVTLPAAADTDSVDAKLREGVLTVLVNKKPEKQQKKINVS